MEVAKFSLHISSNTGTKAANITGQILDSLKEFCPSLYIWTGFLGFRVYANYARYISFIRLDFNAP
jgi:hypothetical protein